MPENELNINHQIALAYENDGLKLDLKIFLSVIRTSRKFGFPLVCTLGDKTLLEQLNWAAKLLIDVAQCYPLSEIPKTFEIEPGTKLYQDARHLLASAMGNTLEFDNLVKFRKTDFSELAGLTVEEGEALSANFNSTFQMKMKKDDDSDQ